MISGVQSGPKRCLMAPLRLGFKFSRLVPERSLRAAFPGWIIDEKAPWYIPALIMVSYFDALATAPLSQFYWIIDVSRERMSDIVKLIECLATRGKGCRTLSYGVQGRILERAGLAGSSTLMR